jgi:H+-transporting ATPase
MVLLGAGSAIPADCLVNDGRIEVDQSALTGESMPVTMYKGDSAKMGSTVTRGEVEATVEVSRAGILILGLELALAWSTASH